MGRKVTGVIFAGGQSTRMGQNKALVKYRHKRLIDIAIKNIYSVCDFILISTNKSLPNVPFLMVEDELKGIGPIGGLYSVLKKSKTKHNIVLACDVPHVESSFIEMLVEKSRGYQAVIPRLPNGKLEPLVAYYSKDALPTILKHIEEENYKLVNLICNLKVKYIEVKNHKMFRNINSPEDLLSQPE